MQINNQLNFKNNIRMLFTQNNLHYILDAFLNAEQLKLTASIQLRVIFIKQRGSWEVLFLINQQNSSIIIEINKLIKYNQEFIDQQSQVQNSLEQWKIILIIS
ncbi:unnamed protein product [Paramecium sonneborni]|uniref:Uncharacterized protein n=1 Tax=Paramecium sonneborni TaxID=65129 RepID=A0A8S1MWQ7_9CILI|nr:unnamed protein product [Paramecium sonneborni]